jgi:metal-sulfur cluster biosynthetic enzyme
LPKEVEDKVKSIEHVKDAEVEITFDPPWSKDLMSEEAKLELECFNCRQKSQSRMEDLVVEELVLLN